MAEHGFHNVPVSLISKESGVAVGTIYFYFNNKQGLMDSMYTDIINDMSKYVSVGIESAKTIEEKIYCFWMGYFNYCINNPLQANFICQPGIEKYISPSLIQYDKEIFGQVKNIIDEGIKEEIIKDLPYNVILSFLIGPIKDIQIFYQAGEIDIDESMMNKIFGVFWNGIVHKNNGETIE